MPRELLSEKDKIAINALMKGKNKTEALLEAGYSRTHTTRFFNNKRVSAELRRRRARLENKFNLSLDQLLQRYLAIADAHVRLAKYKKQSEVTGEIVLDLSEATPEDLAYIDASVSDAKSALDSIAKIMGWDKQKVELSGPDGGPVEVKMDDKELARKLAFIIFKGTKENS